jgi:large subunit ribosomal protein L21
MKFAIIETGGKQFKITPDEFIKVEKLAPELKEGDTIIFDKVLLIEDEKGTTIGTPYIKDAKIEAVFESRNKEKKVIVIRYKQKSKYFKKNGHRQIKDKVTIKGLK